MTNRTLDKSDRDVKITCIVQQGLIGFYTFLPYTEKLSVMVFAKTNYRWIIGRSNHCAIALQDATVSREHAVLGYDSYSGFYIMDCFSRNGTFLNQIRLIPLKRYWLRDRDLLAISEQMIHINISPQDVDLQR
jgi:pSer/pThr/pTyr-binding forkhead associated (FHA) protein